MTLGKQQRLFVRLFGELIAWCYSRDLELSFGEAYRTQEQADWYAARGKGIRNSLHTKRLAVDMNLFIHGKYITDSEAYRELGEQWESMHELCRWGGRFGDGNHFSMEYGGVK